MYVRFNADTSDRMHLDLFLYSSFTLFIFFFFFRAKQASAQQELYPCSFRELRANPQDESTGQSGCESLPEAELQVSCFSTSNEPEHHIRKTQDRSLSRQQQTDFSPADSSNPHRASVDMCLQEVSPETRKSKRCELSDAREDPHPHEAKRMCLGRPPAATQTQSTESLTQTSKYDPLPLPPLPSDESEQESKAFPVSECKKTTLEVELLTPGKQAQRLPFTSNNTAQTNQNRLAASLRGLSVKLASSGSSISSRSTFEEEGSRNVPRTSRLRRVKRSWEGRENLQSRCLTPQRWRLYCQATCYTTPRGLLRWFVLMSKK